MVGTFDLTHINSEPSLEGSQSFSHCSEHCSKAESWAERAHIS